MAGNGGKKWRENDLKIEEILKGYAKNWRKKLAGKNGGKKWREMAGKMAQKIGAKNFRANKIFIPAIPLKQPETF